MGHRPDCPEQAVLSSPKSVLHPGRERTAGGPSGSECAMLLVLLLPTCLLSSSQAAPKAKIMWSLSHPCLQVTGHKAKKTRKNVKNLMKFRHKASIYQMSTCQIKVYVSLSIKKPKHLCIYNTFLMAEETQESIHPVSRKSISPLSVGPNYKKILFNWNHYYTWVFLKHHGFGVL